MWWGKAQEKDKPVRVILSKQIDNQKKFSGKVSEISDTGFTLTDQKTGATKTFAYANVREVHQKGMSRGEKIGTGVAIADAFILVPKTSRRHKSLIPFSAKREKILGVPQKQKINLEKVMASLNTVCPKCGCSITPDKILRIDSERIACPECGERFTPEKRVCR